MSREPRDPQPQARSDSPKPGGRRTVGSHWPVISGALLVLIAALPGCHRHEPTQRTDAAAPSLAPLPPPPSASSSPGISPAAPIPSTRAASSSAASAPPSSAPAPRRPCPPEMVYVPSKHPFCIDRWEDILVDKTTGRRLSPYYPPSRRLAVKIYDRWQSKRWKVGSDEAKRMPLPELPDWQREHDPVVMAVSKPHEIPNGYVSGKVAKLACKNAGKRLCKRSEWVTACEGQAKQQFPYGPEYRRGACNMFRYTHPAGFLHNDVTRGHLDPRLNLVEDKEGPLLRRTGTTPACVSRWKNDGIYDMVGNLDEWVDDPDGTFVGGFFSRAKRDGCLSVVKNHPVSYFDYSLGVRCCADPREPGTESTADPLGGPSSSSLHQ